MARSLHWTHEGSPGDVKLPMASEFPALGSPSGVQQARLWVAGLRRRPSCWHPRPWAAGSATPAPPPRLTLGPNPPPWLLIQVWTPWAPASNVQQTFFQFPIKSPAKLQICEKGYEQWKKKPLPVWRDKRTLDAISYRNDCRRESTRPPVRRAATHSGLRRLWALCWDSDQHYLIYCPQQTYQASPSHFHVQARKLRLREANEGSHVAQQGGEGTWLESLNFCRTCCCKMFSH